VVLTGYDHPTARVSGAAPPCTCSPAEVLRPRARSHWLAVAQALNDVVDVLLVGDSVGMVVHGHQSTVPVTLDAMVMHCAAVARGATRPLLVGDLPFGTYSTVEGALRSATRLLQEGGMHAVKLEGGRAQAGKLSSLAQEGLPVMGHVGLLPQTAPLAGGYGLTGKSAASAMRVVDDALSVAHAGAFSLVLELVPSQLSAFITALLDVPVIGIGAGPHVSGQVLVSHDLLGMSTGRVPSFVKQYASVGRTMEGAFAAYAADVRARTFPGRRATADAASSPLFAHVEAVERDVSAGAASAVSRARPLYSRDMELPEFAAFAEAAARAYGSNPRAMAALDAGHRELQNAAAEAAAAKSAEATRIAIVRAKADAQAATIVRPLFSSPEPSLSVAIVGTGAVASLLASQLAGNHALSCVDMYGRWADRVAAINANGLLLYPQDRSAQAMHFRSAAQGAVGSGPLLRAFNLADSPAFNAVLHWAAGGLPGVSAPGTLPALGDGDFSGRRYDVVLLAGKAMDAPEQVLAAATLVRSVADLGEGEGSASSPATVRGRPGIVIPLYNGAYTAEYALALLARLQREGASPAALAALGPSLSAHLASLRPLGQTGYGVTSSGAVLGVGPGAGVTRTGSGITRVCASPLMRMPTDAEEAAATLLPPEFALHHTGMVPTALSWGDGVEAEPVSMLASSEWNAARWAKLAVNAVLNPTVALLGVTNEGFLPYVEAARARPAREPAPAYGVEGLAAEAAQAALLRAGSGDSGGGAVHLAAPGWEAVSDGPGLLALVEAAARATAPNINSLLADARAGRVGEGDFICGAVVEALEGKAPAQAAALAALHARERAFGIRNVDARVRGIVEGTVA